MKDDVIFSDELNHASIIDGCRLSKAKTLIYRHKDSSHLEDLIRKEDAKNKIVITDTVFSMDGDIAPLGDIYAICKKNNAILYIDDAHGTGVLGNGRGALSHFNIKPEPWIIQMGTFSKALGSFGAFVAGSRDVIEWIHEYRKKLYILDSPALMYCCRIYSCIGINRKRFRINKKTLGKQEQGASVLRIQAMISWEVKPLSYL